LADLQILDTHHSRNKLNALESELQQCRTELEALQSTVNDCVRYRKQVLIPNLPEPPAAVSFPISSKAVAIAGYFHNGKREYFPVESFIKLKPIYYP